MAEKTIASNGRKIANRSKRSVRHPRSRFAFHNVKTSDLRKRIQSIRDTYSALVEELDAGETSHRSRAEKEVAMEYRAMVIQLTEIRRVAAW